MTNKSRVVRRKTTSTAAAIWFCTFILATSAATSQTTSPQPLKPMAADADPAFEVAAIKPAAPDARGMGFKMQGHSFSVLNLTVADMLVFSFALTPKQVTGGPDWLTKDRFDIVATPDTEGRASREQYGIMLRKLLADRFRLTFHHESRELAAYLLEVGKNGPKLKKHTPDEPGPGHLNMTVKNGGMLLDARNDSMVDFTLALQQDVFDQPVLNRTDLPGRFDFQFSFAPDGTRFAMMHLPAPTDEPASSLFTVVQELGLRLEAVKTPIDVLVIDGAEKPSAN